MRIGFHLGPISLSSSTKRRRRNGTNAITAFLQREAAKTVADGPRTDLTDLQRAMVADMNSGMTKREIADKYRMKERQVMRELTKRYPS